MIRSKVVRYFVFFILGAIAVWVIVTILTSYYGIKGDIEYQHFSESIEKGELRRKQKSEEDSAFYANLNEMIGAKQFDVALRYLNERKTKNPSDWKDLTINIGEVYEMKGNQKLANDSYSEVLRYDNSNIPAHLKRAGLYYRQHKLKLTIEEYKLVSSWNKDYYYPLALLYERDGDLLKAKTALDSFFVWDPENKSARLKYDSLKLKIAKFNK